MNKQIVPSGSLTFLRTELETGITFVTIAERAAYEDKIDRNVKNARKAVDSVRHFIGETTLSDSEAAELTEELEELERRVRTLEGRIVK